MTLPQSALGLIGTFWTATGKSEPNSSSTKRVDGTRGAFRVQPTDAIRVQGPTGVWLRPVTDTDEGLPRRARAFPGDAGPAGGGTRGAQVVKAGWDHEHCAICWETLGPGGQPEGYVISQRIWVCERCYVNFVERRSLDFIQSV